MHQLNIKRIILTGVVVFVTIFLSVNLIIFGYAAFLGFQAQGAPDSQKIADFAALYAPWITIGSSLVFSFLAGRRTAHSVRPQRILHSLLVGVFASLLLVAYSIIFSDRIWLDITASALILLSSWLGAKTGIRSKRATQNRSPSSRC